MARRKPKKDPEKPSSPVPFTPDGWREFHQERTNGKGLKLDRSPGAPALLKSMLESLAPGAHVTWSRVCDYIKERHPQAPAEAKAYKRYAIQVLGWREPPRSR